MAGIGFGTNYDAKAGNGLGPKTQIVQLDMDSGNVTQAALDAIVAAIGLTGTVAGISGAVGDAAVFIAVQGGADIATDSSDALGVTGTNITDICTFDQNPV
jgi:hypothetical protein